MDMQMRMSVWIVKGTDFSLTEISASCALMSAICPSNATILASRLACMKGYQYFLSRDDDVGGEMMPMEKQMRKWQEVPRERHGAIFERRRKEGANKWYSRPTYDFLSFD